MADAAIEELISQAAPVRDQDLDRPSVRHASHAVILEHTRSNPAIGAPPESSRPRRRKRLVAATGIAVLGAGIGTAAAQELLPSAHTGEHAEPLGETPTGGEWIRLDAPDALDVLVDLAAPIPLPPGTNPQDVVSTLLTDEPTEMTDHGIQASIAWTSAACAWPRYWLDAQARGDNNAMDNAQTVLDTAPTWEWITTADGGGIADALQATADDLRQGDTTHLEQQLEHNCPPTMGE